MPKLTIKNLIVKTFQVFKEYVWREWYFYLPTAVTYYLIYDWAKKENYKFNRKDSKEFENDT